MLSEKKRREEQLSILEKLKQKGVPSKDNEMNTMFDLGVDEDGKIALNSDEESEEPMDEEEIIPPMAPKKKPQPAMTPLPVGGNALKPKKKRSLT
jgi:hypothetical protein